jgi:hypothetical protein
MPISSELSHTTRPVSRALAALQTYTATTLPILGYRLPRALSLPASGTRRRQRRQQSSNSPHGPLCQDKKRCKLDGARYEVARGYAIVWSAIYRMPRAKCADHTPGLPRDGPRHLAMTPSPCPSSVRATDRSEGCNPRFRALAAAATRTPRRTVPSLDLVSPSVASLGGSPHSPQL